MSSDIKSFLQEYRHKNTTVKVTRDVSDYET